MSLSPQDRAEKSAAALWAQDTASRFIGLNLLSVGPGVAEMDMTVQKQHLNGHGICHGGLIFSLADSAFAFACNSYNQVVVAHHTSINFLNPGQLDDVLTATAREVARSGRTGIYDVAVKNHQDRMIAQFRGCSRVVRGRHFEEDAA
jgi:acyl-CoA thioesterase